MLNNHTKISEARKKKREQVAQIALSLVEQKSKPDFDPTRSPICPMDLIIICGAPWFKECLEKDYLKDESGYKKIGGGANNPHRQYFYRSVVNFIHFLKRQGLYIPRGGQLKPSLGMACFFDWEDRGRFNFSPDRVGIIVKTMKDNITQVVLPRPIEGDYVIKIVEILPRSQEDLAIIGYSDLP